MSTYKKYGGRNHSSVSNHVNHDTINSKNITCLSSGLYNTKIPCLSHIDMSGNSLFHIGSLSFQDGTTITTGETITSNLSQILAQGNSAGGYNINMNNNNILNVNNISFNATTGHISDVSYIQFADGSKLSTGTSILPTLAQILTQGNSANGQDIININKIKFNTSGYITDVSYIQFANGSKLATGTPNLSQILANGNSAGSYGINMNTQNISAVNEISAINKINFNSTGYILDVSYIQFGNGTKLSTGTPNLSQILANGNSAGGYNIDMNSQNISAVNNISFNTTGYISDVSYIRFKDNSIINTGTPNLSQILANGNSAGSYGINMNGQNISGLKDLYCQRLFVATAQGEISFVPYIDTSGNYNSITKEDDAVIFFNNNKLCSISIVPWAAGSTGGVRITQNETELYKPTLKFADGRTQTGAYTGFYPTNNTTYNNPSLEINTNGQIISISNGTVATQKTYSVEYILMKLTTDITIPNNDCIGFSVRFVGVGGIAGDNIDSNIATTWNAGGSGGGASMCISQGIIPITSGTLQANLINGPNQPNYLSYNNIILCTCYNGLDGLTATVNAGGNGGSGQSQGSGDENICNWLISRGSAGTRGGTSISYQNCAGIPATAGKPSAILTTGSSNDGVSGCGQRYSAFGSSTNKCSVPTSSPGYAKLTLTYYLR
jgi:hypothetical protein